MSHFKPCYPLLIKGEDMKVWNLLLICGLLFSAQAMACGGTKDKSASSDATFEESQSIRTTYIEGEPVED